MIPSVSNPEALYPGVPLVPPRRWTAPLVDYELGAFNPSDLGAPYDTVWVSGLAGDTVYVEHLGGGGRVELFARPDVTYISFGFDQLMRPVVAYISNGTPHLFWYDATIPGNVHTPVPEAGSPLVYLDDPRVGESSNNDVHFVYMKGRDLYSRVQRERYEVERLLQADAGSRLVRAGLTDNLRVNWRLQP